MIAISFDLGLQIAIARAKMIAAKSFDRAVALLVSARVNAEAAFAYVAKLVARRAVAA
jgi:hypothetical protein